MMRARGLLLLCCGVPLLAGCGTAHRVVSACSQARLLPQSAGPTISTTNARIALQCAGFPVSTSRFVFDSNLAPPVYIVADRGKSDDWSPAVVFRFRTNALAVIAARHYSRAGLSAMARYWR